MKSSKRTPNTLDQLTEELKSRTARMESEIDLGAQELQEANRKLRAANEELDRRKAELEMRVKESTADLSRANEILRESERRYRLLFENNPHPMWVYDSQTLDFLAVNDAALRHYGYSREEFLSMTLKDIRPPEEIGRLLQDVGQNRTGLDTAGLWKHRKKDGTIIDVEITSNDLDYGGRNAKVVLAHDVTERTKLEAQMLRIQRMESIGTLAGGIAHDLNNVLAPVLMAIQILRMRCGEESEQRILDALEQSTRRGADMIRQVLALARGVVGERSVLQMSRLIAEVEKIVRDTFDRSIEVQTVVPENLWAISGDTTKLYQVLMNLCVNARDAMPEGGILRIEASNVMVDEEFAGTHLEAQPGPYVGLAIADTGTGIPPSIIDKIFEPFFTTKEMAKGTGLGLSTVEGIVKGHGGFVNVESEMGKGTRFRIYFPAVETNGSDAEHREPQELPSGNGELVLVVGDEIAVREITRSTLECYGYTVRVTNAGKAALAVYARHGDEIQVVVTDTMTHGHDGCATIRAFQAMNPGVRIIAMGGITNYESMPKLAELKSVRFLQKPFTADKFLSTLTELLKTSTPGSGLPDKKKDPIPPLNLFPT